MTIKDLLKVGEFYTTKGGLVARVTGKQTTLFGKAAKHFAMVAYDPAKMLTWVWSCDAEGKSHHGRFDVEDNFYRTEHLDLVAHLEGKLEISQAPPGVLLDQLLYLSNGGASDYTESEINAEHAHRKAKYEARSR